MKEEACTLKNKLHHSEFCSGGMKAINRGNKDACTNVGLRLKKNHHQQAFEWLLT